MSPRCASTIRFEDAQAEPEAATVGNVHAVGAFKDPGQLAFPCLFLCTVVGERLVDLMLRHCVGHSARRLQSAFRSPGCREPGQEPIRSPRDTRPDNDRDGGDSRVARNCWHASALSRDGHRHRRIGPLVIDSFLIASCDFPGPRGLPSSR